MTVMDAPSYEAALDSPPPLPYGLFSVVTPVDRADGHWALGVQVDASPACLLPHATVGPCDPSGDKVPDNAYSALTGEPFVVYVLNSCLSVGRLDDAVSRAREALRMGDSYAAERGLAAVLADLATDVPVTYGDTTADVIAAAEQYAAQHYTGQAILHMDRQTALWGVAQHALRVDGSMLRTGLGTPVVAGGGYSAPAGQDSTAITSLTADGLTATLDAQGTSEVATPAMDGMIYATGQVRLYRGDISSHPLTIDLQHNTFYALAERSYVPLVDCFAARFPVARKGYCCGEEAPV